MRAGADEPGYVCRLVTEQVRGIKDIKRGNPESNEIEEYEVCVEATPQPGNEAHADIYTKQSAPNKSAQKTVFRMLKEELARIAEWEPGFGPSGEEQPSPDDS